MARPATRGRPRPDPGNQLGAADRGDERSHRQRQPGEAGLERRVAEDLLEVEGDDEEHPVDRRAEEDAGDVRAEQRGEPEDPERDQRRDRAAFDHGERCEQERRGVSEADRL